MAQAVQRHVTLMFILDTNHLVELGHQSDRGIRLIRRLGESSENSATSIVSVEEQLRGWMAELHKTRNPHDQIRLYLKLHERIDFFSSWMVLDWDAEAADLFLGFRRQGIRVGTQDLKIACITIAHHATLLTRNLADFRLVPGLRVENWLD